MRQARWQRNQEKSSVEESKRLPGCGSFLAARFVSHEAELRDPFFNGIFRDACDGAIFMRYLKAGVEGCNSRLPVVYTHIGRRIIITNILKETRVA